VSPANDRPRVLLGITGGIAAYKAPELVRRLRDAGFDVRCALTQAGSHFVSKLALEVVSGAPVFGEEYLDANGSGEELHIRAAAESDLLLIAPATAHTLASLALGLADNFLLTTALAFRGPILIAPAMHAAMWERSSTRRRLHELVDAGIGVIGPEVGPLASGEVAIGRMSEIATLVSAVEQRLKPQGPLVGKRVVVSAGPTFEPIDPVRFLGNRSSGKMGFAIAEAAARAGAEVTLVAGPVALETPRGVERVDVTTAVEMAEAIHRAAAGVDVIVMAAAVADFRPAHPAAEKLKKRLGPPRIDLVANPDILSGLAAVAPSALRVGFAAETVDLDGEAVRKLSEKSVHLLVANDVSRRDIGFAADENEVAVFRHEGEPVRLAKASKRQIAEQLVALIGEELSHRRREPEPAGG